MFGFGRGVCYCSHVFTSMTYYMDSDQLALNPPTVTKVRGRSTAPASFSFKPMRRDENFKKTRAYWYGSRRNAASVGLGCSSENAVTLTTVISISIIPSESYTDSLASSATFPATILPFCPSSEQPPPARAAIRGFVGCVVAAPNSHIWCFLCRTRSSTVQD